MYIDYVSLLVNSNKTNISFRSTFPYSASFRVCRYLLVSVCTRLRSLWTITVIDVRTNHTSSKLITNTIVFADTVELLIDRVFDCIKRFYLKNYIVWLLCHVWSLNIKFCKMIILWNKNDIRISLFIACTKCVKSNFKNWRIYILYASERY